VIDADADPAGIAHKIIAPDHLAKRVVDEVIHTDRHRLATVAIRARPS
jgi:hypothetical protein